MIPPARGRFAARLRGAMPLMTGLVLFAVIAWWLVPGPAERTALIHRVHVAPAWLLLGLLATFVASLVTSARWQRMAEDAMGGAPLPYLVYFHALVLTRVLGQVSSTLAMDLVGRGLALRRAGAPQGLGHSVTQAVLERIFDLVLPLLMLAWALACGPTRTSPTLALAGFIAVCVGFTGLATVTLAPLTRLALRCLTALRRLRVRAATDASSASSASPTPSASPIPAAPSASLASPVPPVPRGLALRVGALSLVRYLAVLLQFWAVAAGVGVVLGAWQIAAATPIGQLAGMAGVTPGALGVQEAGWLGALAWVGLDAAAIAVFVLAQRLVLTSYFAVLSLLSWLLLRRTRPATCPPGQVPT